MAEDHLGHIAFFESSLLFSGSVAHDIRKPFRRGIIYDYLQKINTGLDNPQTKAEALSALADLGHCLKNLHTMSEKMVSGFEDLEAFLRRGFKAERIDYVQKINEESRSFKAMAEEKGIAFEIIFTQKEFFLYADALSVQRILNELLTNAIKYTERGKITVKVSCENPQEVLTEVSDTGCGIADENQEEIWELFKRGKNGQTKEGAGIGLAMVRQLVEANAGKIWLNSERGKGSSFFFTLPTWEDKKVR
jgi:signal transduction histidine kinase